MWRHLTLAVAAFSAIAAPLAGQQTYQRTATITGTAVNGQGKCTIEVVVDGVAEIEVRGQYGTMRNLSGQTLQWRRFECVGTMPLNPVGFQFRGIDGRGRQQLIRDPQNGGSAVVRVEDSSGGSEGYTFDLTWTGGDVYNDPYSNQSQYPNNQGQYGNQGRGRGNRGRYSADDAIRLCQDAVRQRVGQRARATDITFPIANFTDNAGARDQVVGTFNTPNGQTRGFTCDVNTNNGRVQSVQLDRGGANSSIFGDRTGVRNSQAIQNCERSVTDRIRRDGYDRVTFGSTTIDDRSVQRPLVIGTANASGNIGSNAFSFSCAMNANNNVVQSVDVVRR